MTARQHRLVWCSQCSGSFRAAQALLERHARTCCPWCGAVVLGPTGAGVWLAERMAAEPDLYPRAPRAHSADRPATAAHAVDTGEASHLPITLETLRRVVSEEVAAGLAPATAPPLDVAALARELAALLPAAQPEPAPLRGAGTAAATTGHWARLTDIACNDLGEGAVAEVLGVGVGAVQSWRTGRSVPRERHQHRMERLGVALWALRLGLDDGALADAREALRTLARGRWAAAAWAEVAGAEEGEE